MAEREDLNRCRRSGVRASFGSGGELPPNKHRPVDTRPAQAHNRGGRGARGCTMGGGCLGVSKLEWERIEVSR